MEESHATNPFSRIRVRWLFISWVIGTIALGIALEYSSFEQETRIFFLSILSIAIIGIGTKIMAQQTGLRPALLFGRMLHLKDIVAVPLIVPLKIISLLFLLAIGALLQLSGDEFQAMPLWTSNTQVVFYILSSIVIAPIVEEFFFRGILLHRFAVRWGITAAIFYSSILFGILHLDDFFGAALIGAVLCLLYIRTRSLFVPILVHMAYNAMSAFFVTDMGIAFLERLDQFPEQVLALFSLLFIVQSCTVLIWFYIYFWPQSEAVLPYDAA